MKTFLLPAQALRILDQVRVVFRRPADPNSETKDSTVSDMAVNVDQIVANAQRQLQVRDWGEQFPSEEFLSDSMRLMC